jgi:SAM-dependent methyltransferase
LSLTQGEDSIVQHFIRFGSRPLAASLVAACCLLSGPAYAQDGQDKPKLDVIYVPTPQEVVDRMLEMAQVKAGDFVIDLGCGDGRNVVTAAQKYGARGFGVDIDPERIKEANENAKKAGVTDKVEFRVANLFETKISDANVMMMYLLSTINLKLRPRILDEMKPGSRIVSHAFDMGDWKPDQRDTVGYRNVYSWIVPAKVEGRWNVKSDGQAFTLDLKQKFQEVEGTASLNGRDVPIRDAHLRGEEIRFVVDLGEGRATTFTGKVDGTTMRASPGAGGHGESAKDWQATKA